MLMVRVFPNRLGRSEKGHCAMAVNEPPDQVCLVYEIVSIGNQCFEIFYAYGHPDHELHSFPMNSHSILQ